MIWFLVACVVGGGVVGGGEQSFHVDDVEAVQVRLENGELSVLSQSSEPGQAYVAFEGGGVAPEDLFSTELVDGTLFVDAACALTCGGELVLEVPAGVPVDACLVRGEIGIWLEEPAPVSACVRTGELDLNVPAGAYDLALDVGIGELSVSGVQDTEDAPRLELAVGVGELSLSGI